MHSARAHAMRAFTRSQYRKAASREAPRQGRELVESRSQRPLTPCPLAQLGAGSGTGESKQPSLCSRPEAGATTALPHPCPLSMNGEGNRCRRPLPSFNPTGSLAQLSSPSLSTLPRPDFDLPDPAFSSAKPVFQPSLTCPSTLPCFGFNPERDSICTVSMLSFNPTECRHQPSSTCPSTSLFSTSALLKDDFNPTEPGLQPVRMPTSPLRISASTLLNLFINVLELSSLGHWW